MNLRIIYTASAVAGFFCVRFITAHRILLEADKDRDMNNDSEGGKVNSVKAGIKRRIIAELNLVATQQIRFRGLTYKRNPYEC